MVVHYQSWQPQLAAVGSLRAVRGVDVTTEVAGLVREVAFVSGQQARAGQVLVRLNADSDVARVTRDSGSGLLVAPDAPGELAAAVRWCLHHPAELSDMGRRGRDRYCPVCLLTPCDAKPVPS